ncbi:MAG: hypothetical protein ACR2LK_13780 [Solirubrobacteraceae bacterium]
MRTHAIAIVALAVLALATAAVARAPVKPRGNFGGGALVSPPKDIFGPGNAVVGLRALPKRKLEIAATVRARCAGGDITATAKIAANGRFRANGTATQEPNPALRIRTRYRLSGRFTDRGSAHGTIAASIRRSLRGRTKTCRTGKVRFRVRRATSRIGKAGAPKGARYYGTTSQRSTAARRPIVLRVSGDGRRLRRGLFSESVKCSDGTVSIGVEAPRTNVRIDRRGRVRDRERFEIKEGETLVRVDDRFTANIGSKGARGTFSLSDRTIDRASGRTIRTCRSGKVRWRASR